MGEVGSVLRLVSQREDLICELIQDPKHKTRLTTQLQTFFAVHHYTAQQSLEHNEQKGFSQHRTSVFPCRFIQPKQIQHLKSSLLRRKTSDGSEVGETF